MYFRKGVELDCFKASTWYSASAEAVIEDYQKLSKISQKYSEFPVRLGEPIDSTAKDGPDFFQYHHYLASTGDVHALSALGLINLRGIYGQPQDFDLARDYFEQAAEQGHASSLVNLGLLYETGTGVKKDYQKAFSYYKQASDSGSPRGQTALGMMYMYGYGTEQDATKATKLLQKASNSGSSEATYYLGLIYSGGFGIKASLTTAFQYFTNAASLDYPPAALKLADSLLYGHGSAPSCHHALELYKKLSDMDTQILFQAYQAYEQYEFEKALALYTKAAALGHEIGQYNAAYMFERGLGCSSLPDHERYRLAWAFYADSAEQGYTKSLVKIGDFYFYGKISEVDYVEAAHYYTEAADQGNSQAFFNLGYLHQVWTTIIF